MLKKDLFTIDETTALNNAVKNDPIIKESIYGRYDASGAITELRAMDWVERGHVQRGLQGLHALSIA